MKILSIIAFLILQTCINMPFNSSNLKASDHDDIIDTESKMNITLANPHIGLSINDIPNELLYSIFTRLDAKDLITVESICHRFSVVVSEVWKNQMKEIDLSKSLVSLEKINKFVTDSRPFRYLNISKPNFNKTDLQPEIFDLLATKISLQKLDISGNILYASQLTHLSTLTNLSSLSMNRTIIFDFGAEALESISQLTKLTHLQINCNQLNPKALQHLTHLVNLRHLDISYNFALDDTSVPYLESLKNLEVLNISDTNFTIEGVKQLKIKNIIKLTKAHNK